MKRLLHALLLATAWCSARGADDELPPLIADAAHDPAWSALFAQLVPQQSRQSAFAERRYFPFRTEPVVLTGEIRMTPDRGVSLSYLTPEVRILIADAKGLLMRDAKGRERAPPADRRMQVTTDALINVLRFDLATLEKSFVIRGRREGEKWTIAFVPRDPALAKDLGTVVLGGMQARLQRIIMMHSATQRIEILVGETHDNVVFPPEVLKRFFR